MELVYRILNKFAFKLSNSFQEIGKIAQQKASETISESNSKCRQRAAGAGFRAQGVGRLVLA